MDQAPKDKKSVPEFFQQVWSQALMAVTGAEEEATKLLNRIQGAAGWSQEEAKRQVNEFTHRLATQRKDLEKRLDDAVKQSLARVRVPRREEIAQLNARLDAITKRVEALSK